MKKRSTKCFCTILQKLFSYASAKMQTYSFDRTENWAKFVNDTFNSLLGHFVNLYIPRLFVITMWLIID